MLRVSWARERWHMLQGKAAGWAAWCWLHASRVCRFVVAKTCLLHGECTDVEVPSRTMQLLTRDGPGAHHLPGGLPLPGCHPGGLHRGQGGSHFLCAGQSSTLGLPCLCSQRPSQAKRKTCCTTNPNQPSAEPKHKQRNPLPAVQGSTLDVLGFEVGYTVKWVDPATGNATLPTSGAPARLVLLSNGTKHSMGGSSSTGSGIWGSAGIRHVLRSLWGGRLVGSRRQAAEKISHAGNVAAAGQQAGEAAAASGAQAPQATTSAPQAATTGTAAPAATVSDGSSTAGGGSAAATAAMSGTPAAATPGSATQRQGASAEPGSNQCLLRIEVMKESSTEGHKVKVRALGCLSFPTPCKYHAAKHSISMWM